MLARSSGDWNRGDLAGFMSDYVRDSLTSYVSGGRVIYGWQTLYDSYATRYFGPGAARDSLAFTDVRVRALTPNLALAAARFCLLRRDSVTASGPFTLVLTRRPEGWKILHDHSQGDTKPWCTQ
ncbi:MAG: YybH family protein [Gemmatimonadales bacterium]